ncbi:serine hydrolase domain-containing protein [Clostridium sp. C2-6-12]|uniref:serine hydrolase domain-containing protein n=1 Tax=Clostridium sp. C2-6-12 TaxID=2698832 RepID=UPI00136F3F41|nr:serine hydrolase domain-containing protein [Clostridium sp. C2-6-12]
MDDIFKEVIPEEVGIPSQVILNFIKQLEDNQVNMHGFLMIREDKVFAEGYWKPFNKDFQHRMYSAGKSFTSIAIGLLQEEGKLKITDHICDYFKDKLPKDGAYEYIKKITIEDMLTMRTAHNKTTYKVEENNDWVESFFKIKPSHHPGTIFSYDTSATHVLSALVERLSGKSLMEYLREKVLNYINFSEEAKFLKDPMGISQGGSGLICTMRDLAKLTYICMENGVYKDKQLIPKFYIQEATKKQVDTFIQSVIDEQQGYGYQFWKSRYGGFTLYGMGGQLSICLPQYKVIFTTIADTQGNPTGLQNIYDAFWQQVFPYINREYKMLDKNEESFIKLKEKIDNLYIKPIEGEVKSQYISKINGKKYILESNLMELKYFKITFENKEGFIEYKNVKGKFKIPFTLGKIKKFEQETLKISMLISAAWKSENILCFQINLIGELLGSIRVNIGFNNEFVTISSKKYVEGILNNYDGIAVGHADK